jgi:diketogulonate reductase-like aldo/keto reductase
LPGQDHRLLTANREVLASSALGQIAECHGRSAAEIVFRFALEVGMIPLTGTTSADHMQADLGVFDFQLEPVEVERIERLATG